MSTKPEESREDTKDALAWLTCVAEGDPEGLCNNAYNAARAGVIRRMLGPAPKGRALVAISSGVPVGEAAKANGVHRATVARARHVANEPSNATPHDPETGEISKSCGGDSLECPGHVGLTAGTQHGASGAERACPESAPAGLAPGPQDTRTFTEIVGDLPAHLRRVPV